MSIIATNTVNYTPVPKGTHLARIYQIIHVGTIPNFMGEYKNTVRIAFELPTETRQFKEGEPEKPFSIAKNYTLSTHERAGLRKVIEACIGTTLQDEEAIAFDVTELIGKVCLVTVTHKQRKQGDGVYSLIDTVSPIVKGMQIPDAVNQSVIFDYGDNFSEDLLEALPDFLKKDMKESDEYRARIAMDKGGDFEGDDVPF